MDMTYRDATYEKCPQITSNVLDLVEEKVKPNDIVLNVSYYTVLNAARPDNGDPTPGIIRVSNPEETMSAEKAYSQIEQELTEIAKRLERKGAQLVVQAPLPVHRAQAEQCLPTWFSAQSGLKSDCFTERSQILDDQQQFRDALAVVQQQTNSLYVWDVFDELCSETMCSHFKEGRPLFFDDNHLSVYGSKSLSSNFVSFLKTQSLL